MKILIDIFCQKLIVSNVISALLDHVKPKNLSPTNYGDRYRAPPFSKSLHPPLFLIHSGSLQKILTALFNLVWNAQKIVNGQCFFECQGKMFLCTEKVLEKISEDQP